MAGSNMTGFSTLHPTPETRVSDSHYHSLETRCQRLASLRYWTRLAKRRTALLESNRPRNSQPETHRDDEVRGVAVGVAPHHPNQAPNIGLIDFLLPWKTHKDSLCEE